jgi:hypothetical protein
VRELAQGTFGWGRLRAENQKAIAMRFETARNPELIS